MLLLQPAFRRSRRNELPKIAITARSAAIQPRRTLGYRPLTRRPDQLQITSQTSRSENRTPDLLSFGAFSAPFPGKMWLIALPPLSRLLLNPNRLNSLPQPSPIHHSLSHRALTTKIALLGLGANTASY